MIDNDQTGDFLAGNEKTPFGDNIYEMMADLRIKVFQAFSVHVCRCNLAIGH
jgi:hypothetical protein